MQLGKRIRRSFYQFFDTPAKRAVIYVGLGLIGLVTLLLFAKLLPGHLTGEAFFDFSFPYLHSWKDSITHFFFERDRGRFLHGILVTGLYAGFGYNPPVFYLASHILVILAAVALGLLIAEYTKNPWLAVLVTLAACLMPLALQDMLSLKKLHHALAWALFWWSCFFFVEWGRRGIWPWLLGTLLFPLSVLSYEAVAMLFPIAFLLSLPHIKSRKDFWLKMLAAFIINLVGVLAFWQLEQLKPVGGADVFYTGGVSELIERLARLPGIFELVARAIGQGGLLSIYIPLNPWLIAFVAFFLLAVLLAALAAFVGKLGPPRTWGLATLQRPQIFLFLSAFWLSFAAYVPFMLAGQLPDNDSLRGAASAVFFLAIAALVGLNSGHNLSRTITAFLIFWLIVGSVGYTIALDASIKQSDQVNNYIISLKRLVPAIKEDAVIVHFNAGLSRSGCAGLQNMIFNRRTIRCVHLIEGDTEESFARVEGWLEEPKTGGRYELDIIILTFDETGEVRLIDEISPEDYPDLPIIWEIREPLRTVHDIIYPEDYESGLRSQIYDYALEYARHH